LNGNDKKYSYIRLSSIDQNESRQVESMKALVIAKDNMFIDKISGKNTNRPQYQELEKLAQEGDTIVFDIVQVVVADLILSLLAAFSQKEREDIKLRQAEGIAVAKAKGKFKGRITKLVEGGEEEVRRNAIIKAYQERTSIVDIRKTYKVGTGTIYRLLEREGIRR
jgi:DNA invertase Pin-like site-specific DNA recombinase